VQLSEAPVLGAPGRPFAGTDEPPAARRECSFRVGWASTPGEVAEAQRLRFRVFVGEMGARIHPPAGTPPGHEADGFDEHCAHLLVRAIGTARHGQVIATCRVLPPDGARRAGGLYTAGEFDLAPLRALLPDALEMGRMCVDADWRNGLVVMALWRELGQQLVRRGLGTMIGCSSVGMADGGALARQMWHDLRQDHLAAAEHQVRAWTPLPMPPTDGPATQVAVPALIKGYLRLGGQLLGPPAIDADFNTADFPMMLRIADMPARYGRRIFGA
jgi:putative hemolysin